MEDRINFTGDIGSPDSIYRGNIGPPDQNSRDNIMGAKIHQIQSHCSWNSQKDAGGLLPDALNVCRWAIRMHPVIAVIAPENPPPPLLQQIWKHWWQTSCYIES